MDDAKAHTRRCLLSTRAQKMRAGHALRMKMELTVRPVFIAFSMTQRVRTMRRGMPYDVWPIHPVPRPDVRPGPWSTRNRLDRAEPPASPPCVCAAVCCAPLPFLRCPLAWCVAPLLSLPACRIHCVRGPHSRRRRTPMHTERGMPPPPPRCARVVCVRLVSTRGSEHSRVCEQSAAALESGRA